MMALMHLGAGLLAEPAGHAAKQEDRERERHEEIARELDREAMLCEQRAQRGNAVPPEMAREHILERPQPLESGDRQIEPSRWTEQRVQGVEKGVIVLNMLEDVEEPDGGQGAGRESGILDRGAHDGLQTAFHSRARTLDAGLDEHRV